MGPKIGWHLPQVLRSLELEDRKHEVAEPCERAYGWESMGVAV